MKNTLLTPLLPKAAAILALGGTPSAAAQALEYTNLRTPEAWPETLTLEVSDRVRGAAWRLGLIAAPAVTPDTTPPAPRPTKRRGWCLRGGRAA